MFNKSNFCHIASNNRNEQKGSVFIYKTTDTLAQVTQSGYFNEKLIDINVHDLIIHVQYDPVARTLKKSVLIVTERTMDNVETAPILDQTIGDDLADLGDQVQGIEEKIPENASAQNQLATKNQITDLQTALSQGLAQKQDIATAVNYDNITNCITEIPQDIKLEIDSNGYLILKAGSKLYVPNGAGVFDVITVSSDTRMNTTSTGTLILFCRNNAVSAVVSGTGKTSSGETDSLAGETYHTWYDTTNNFIYRYSADATTPAYKLTLPLAIVTMTTGGICTSIDQVFNGFGYIGSTIFALPGVKGLIPNGRNEDGSLKNIDFATSSVLKATDATTSTNVLIINNGSISRISATNYFYDEQKNILINKYNNAQILATLYGFNKTNNGVVSEFATKPTFHAVDYNDLEELDNNVVHKTGDETIGGNKTFTGRVLVESADNEITFSNPDYTAFKGFARRSSAGFIVGTLTDSSWKKYFTFTDNDITSNTPIRYTSTQFAKKNVDTSYIEVNGGTTYINGAYLRLDGKDGPELGGFRLATGDGSKGIMLKGTTSGSLQWNGKEIVRLEAEQKPSSSNNYTWYRKYSDGWVEQGGVVNTAVTSPNTINLPVAMADANYTPIGLVQSNGNGTGGYTGEGWADRTTTSFKVYGHAASAAITNAYSWVVFGKAA